MLAVSTGGSRVVSLLYRAIWNDDREDLVASALGAFRGWVTGKSDGGLVVPDDGRTVGTTVVRTRAADGPWVELKQPAEATVDQAVSSGHGPVAGVVLASLVETRDDGSRWTTTLRSWSCREPADADSGEGSGWLWVDVEAVTSESLAGTVTGVPRVVRDLIDAGQSPRRRCVPLTVSASRYQGEEGAEELAGLLSHTDRDLPMAVFSDDPAVTRPPDGPAFYDDVVARAAARVLGMAAVAVVDPAASNALNKILSRRHGVWGGAVRIYLPGLDPATDRDEWRHRYVPREQYLRYRDTAATLLARAVGPAAAARRAPDSYDAAKALLDGSRQADAGELAVLLGLADEEAAQQRTAAAASEERYFDLLSDHNEVLEDRARVTAALEQSQRRLLYAESLIAATAPGDYQLSAAEAAVPVTAATPSQAAHQAREHLSDHLDLPDTACVDLDQLDAALEAGPWGQTSWQALRSLHAYAREMAEGETRVRSGLV